jgi:hypothetical protein
MEDLARFVGILILGTLAPGTLAFILSFWKATPKWIILGLSSISGILGVWWMASGIAWLGLILIILGLIATAINNSIQDDDIVEIASTTELLHKRLKELNEDKPHS